jgi:Tol biopolymer transport system component
MKANGKGGRLIDGDGWGAQWSPNRNEISYVVYNSGTAELVVHDVASGKRRTLPLENAYSQITWGHTWSPDGKWLCFKGDLIGGGSEIAAVSTEEDKKGFKVIVPSTTQPEIDNADATIGWGGPGDEILISTKTKTDRLPRLYLLDFAGKKPPKLLPGIPADWSSVGPAWLPGSKKMVFSAMLPSRPAPVK